MKKLVSALLCLCMLFSLFGCQAQRDTTQTNEKKTEPKINYTDNLKAVWLSYYEIGDIFRSLDESAAKEKADDLFADLNQRGINTVFFHVRAFCDAFYQSSLFPRSAYCAPDYDLLKIVLHSAHQNDISLHAWVNPYRVATDTEPDRLPETSPAVKLYKEDTSNLILTGGDIYLNPGSTATQKLILDGIREIVSHYDVDGIHFDDYFYPGSAKSMDKTNYAKYRDAKGRLTLEDFRRENVSALIAATYCIVKAQNENMLFGVSPQCFVEKNREELYADLQQWLERGCVDYLMPQIYFGFENESAPFEKNVDEWCERMKDSKAKLYVGLALYKSGTEDAYASENTENKDSAFYEWQNNNDIIARQIRYLKQKGVQGFSLYSYTSLTAPGENKTLQQEVHHLSALLK